MAAVKERMKEIIESQPDDSSYEEILRELALDYMIARGMKDSKEDRVISNQEMERRIESWRK